MAHPKTVLAAFVLLGFSGLLGGPFSALPAAAQGRWMDIGSEATYTIADEHDPLSFERFPPRAFGNWPPASLLRAELVPLPCSALPSTAICKSGRFVAGFSASLMQDVNCSCSGGLMRAVELELHYDPALVASLMAREEDLRLTAYDGLSGEWVELADQQVFAERDIVAGFQLGHARQIYAILVPPKSEGSPSGSGEASTWGRIKAQWRDR